jgi:uncharacterized protein involved in type VI secretion and phage assembly
MTDNPLAFLTAGAHAHRVSQPISGVVTARVERLEDNGMCRLRILGMSGQGDDQDSVPARIMSPMAGQGRGMHFMPEPGDEVVCAFQASHPAQPIVLGGLWNGRSTPPSQARQSTDNDVRTIVSRSGHELTFDDASGAEKVVLRTQGGHSVELDDSSGSMKITIRTNGARTIVLDDTASGRVSIESTACRIVLDDSVGSVSIDARSSISLSAQQISLSAASVSIEGSPYRAHTHTGVTSGTSISGPVGT